MTCRACASSPGCTRSVQASLLTVSAGAGTDPVRRAQSAAESRSQSRAASGADSVSFQSLASRSGRPSPSSMTSPWPWPPTDTAAMRGR